MATGGDAHDQDLPPRVCFSRACNNLISPGDGHSTCMHCLGLEHARNAFEVPGFCPCCLMLSDREKGRRLSRVRARLDGSTAPRDEWPPLPPRPTARWAMDPRATSTGVRPRAPAATSQRREADTGYPSPVRKAPRTNIDPARPSSSGAAAPRRHPAASFSFASFRTERSYAADLQSYSSRADPTEADYTYEPLPPRCQLPAGMGWGDYMDGEDPVDDLPSYQEPPAELRVIDEVGYDEDPEDLDLDAPVFPFGEEDQPHHEDDMDEEPPRPAVDPPEVRPADPPEAHAPQVEVPPGDHAGPPPPPRPLVEGWDLVELLRQASIRCGREWPVVLLPQDPEDTWPGAPTETRQPRTTLPLAQGFKATFTANWAEPAVTPPTLRHTKVPFDTVDMPSAGLGTMPAVGPIMGAYLLDPTAPRIKPLAKDPDFPNKKDRDASNASIKLFSLLTAAGKHHNTIALLQGSLSAILEGLGDPPTLDELAEIRRIHQELIKFVCSSTALLGRATTAVIMAERVRWLDISPRLDSAARKDLLEGPILPGGLFKGALERMALAVEEQRPGCEALAALAPRPVVLQSRSQPPRQAQRQQWPQRRQSGHGQQAPQRPRQPRADAPGPPPRAPSADARDGQQQRSRDQRRRPPTAPAAPKKAAPRNARSQQRK